jgi:hypothetical protein
VLGLATPYSELRLIVPLRLASSGQKVKAVPHASKSREMSRVASRLCSSHDFKSCNSTHLFLLAHGDAGAICHCERSAFSSARNSSGWREAEERRTGRGVSESRPGKEPAACAAARATGHTFNGALAAQTARPEEREACWRPLAYPVANTIGYSDAASITVAIAATTWHRTGSGAGHERYFARVELSVSHASISW